MKGGMCVCVCVCGGGGGGGVGGWVVEKRTTRALIDRNAWCACRSVPLLCLYRTTVFLYIGLNVHLDFLCSGIVVFTYEI